MAVTARVDEHVHQQLADLANENDATIAWVVRRAIDRYLESLGRAGTD